MPIDNPFADNRTEALANEQMSGTSEEIVGRCIRELVETRPWVRFLGIIFAIAAGMLGMCICIFVPGIAFGGRDIGTNVLIIAIYLSIGMLHALVARFLLGYASSITQAEMTGSLEDVAEALAEQKRYWKLVGIVNVIILVIVVVLIADAALSKRGGLQF
jgi:hypothetical protein